MQHKCKVTVIDKKVFTDFQEKYLADPHSGACPFYKVGDEFLFERYGNADDFWRCGKGTQCAEAWDCISRYIYTALQGGSIMHGWTNDDRIMIACCNDGTRPVIFKIERIDYKAVHFDKTLNNFEKTQFINQAKSLENVLDVKFHDDGFLEVYVNGNVDDGAIKTVAAACKVNITHID